MTKRDLVTRVAEEVGMAQADVGKVLEEMLDTVSQTLAEGGRLEFRGFGVFEVKTRAQHKGRNPRTGEQVSVPPRSVVKYRQGKELAKLMAAASMPAGQAPKANAADASTASQASDQ